MKQSTWPLSLSLSPTHTHTHPHPWARTPSTRLDQAIDLRALTAADETRGAPCAVAEAVTGRDDDEKQVRKPARAGLPPRSGQTGGGGRGGNGEGGRGPGGEGGSARVLRLAPSALLRHFSGKRTLSGDQGRQSRTPNPPAISHLTNVPPTPQWAEIEDGGVGQRWGARGLATDVISVEEERREGPRVPRGSLGLLIPTSRVLSLLWFGFVPRHKIVVKGGGSFA